MDGLLRELDTKRSTFATSCIVPVRLLNEVHRRLLSDNKLPVTYKPAPLAPPPPLLDLKELLNRTTAGWTKHPPAPKVPLDALQMDAVNAAVERGESVFITGPGGVGKGAVAQHIINMLTFNNKKVKSVASTGIAAVANGGTTIHALLGTGICSSIRGVKKLCKTDALRRARDRLLDNCDVIVWDEVSMNHGDFLAMTDFWLRKVMGTKQPFGGIQMVFVGDFLQLPPVITENDVVKHHYAFQSPAWRDLKLKVYHLQKCYRADNKELVKHLLRIRRGHVPQDTIDYFNATKKHKLENPTELFATNHEADMLNRKRLRAWEGEETVFEGTYTGYPDAQERLAKVVPVDDKIRLKVGVPVLLMKNTDSYVNGDRGVVLEILPATVSVKLENGTVIGVQRHKWELKNGDGHIQATFSQFPIRLAWGITMHKSQGMSLSRVKVHIARCFEKGQAYVALSRVTSYEGLCVADGIKKSAVKTSKLCKDYYKRLPKIVLKPPVPKVETPAPPKPADPPRRFTPPADEEPPF